MNYTTLMEEINAREKRAEPFSGFEFFHFHRYESREIGPESMWIKSQGTKISSEPLSGIEQDLHSDKCIGRGQDERMERYNRRVWVILEVSNNLHFIPAIGNN